MEAWTPPLLTTPGSAATGPPTPATPPPGSLLHHWEPVKERTGLLPVVLMGGFHLLPLCSLVWKGVTTTIDDEWKLKIVHVHVYKGRYLYIICVWVSSR